MSVSSQARRLDRRRKARASTPAEEPLWRGLVDLEGGAPGSVEVRNDHRAYMLTGNGWRKCGIHEEAAVYLAWALVERSNAAALSAKSNQPLVRLVDELRAVWVALAQYVENGLTAEVEDPHKADPLLASAEAVLERLDSEVASLAEES